MLRLWGIHARLDCMWLLKDFNNFAICTITDVIENIASVAGVWLIAEKFAGIGGIGKYQILFLLGYSLTVSGIINTFFGSNVFYISRTIGRGQLDHVLMQPQPVWLTLLTEGFIPASGSAVLLTGVIMLSYAISMLSWAFNLTWLLLLVVSILLSTVVNLCYSFLWGTLAFYSPVAAEEVCTSVVELFSTLRNFPLGGIARFWQLILLSVIPVGICAWYPTVYLNSANVYFGVTVVLIIAIIFILITFLAFRKGLDYYVRKGSYRYYDRGHRR